MRRLNAQAEVAHLVEHDLAKVGVAGSSPVFRSVLFSVLREKFFYNYFRVKLSMDVCLQFNSLALVVKLVDTQDLKSCDPQRS